MLISFRCCRRDAYFGVAFAQFYDYYIERKKTMFFARFLHSAREQQKELNFLFENNVLFDKISRYSMNIHA